MSDILLVHDPCHADGARRDLIPEPEAPGHSARARLAALIDRVIAG